MDDEKLYTPTEAAEYLKIPLHVLRYMRSRGKVRGIRVGNSTVYKKEWLDNANMEHDTPGPQKGKATHGAKKKTEGNKKPPVVLTA